MSINYALEHIDQLQDLSAISGELDAYSTELIQIKENSERVRFFLKHLQEFDIKVEGKPKSEKNNAISESCRTKGNQFYEKSQFLDALSSYNESLCFAEPGSKNIALAYANRSAVYSELKLYEKCLKNIELAKVNHYPNLEKLKKREETCLLMMINNLSPSNVPIGADYLKLSHPANKKLPFVADCLELKTDKEFGRHIITKTALQPGDVVCCEEPFVKFLKLSHRFKYCASCLSDNFMDLFPCNDCTSTMFCSEECEKVGQEKFHKFECPIIDKLDSMCTEAWRTSLGTFFKALYVCDGNLNDLKALMEENKDSSMTVFDYEYPVEAKTVLKVIDALSTNESKRDKIELFQRTGAVAILCDLFLNNTKLREILVTRSDEDFFYSFVFKHGQIAECNYHRLQNGVVNKSEIESNPQYGSGSFPFCSLLNHSCASNVIRENSNCMNYLIVIRPIPAGGQLFDNYGYGHFFETLQERQTILQDYYKFKCTCEACEGNYPSGRDLECSDLRFFKLIVEDSFKLSQLNFDLARKNFKSYCDYLKRMDYKYPILELSLVRDLFERCLKSFAMSDFMLKLCEH